MSEIKKEDLTEKPDSKGELMPFEEFIDKLATTELYYEKDYQTQAINQMLPLFKLAYLRCGSSWR